ncbi:MAG: histidine phosphatase family protein [Pseudomonadota bacterium]
MFNRPLIACFLTLLACASAMAQDCDDSAGTSIYLVRHAEKLDGPDPALTEEGQARAEALREVMADIALDAIYVTQWQRTRMTAEPVAIAQGVAMRVHSTEGQSTQEHVQEVVDDLIENHCGEQVLVVGHSNTIPRIIAGLTAQPMDDLDERDYDHFYQVRIWRGRPAELFQTHFGAVNRSGES